MAADQGFIVECPAEDFNGLLPELRTAFENAVREYRKEVAGQSDLVVTSACRSLRRQAELMAAMSDVELDSMYCRHGRPSYIDALEAARPLDAEKAYWILANRTEGYISRHLQGMAVDVDAESVADAEKFKQKCLEQGCSVLDEREFGRSCLHVSVKKERKV